MSAEVQNSGYSLTAKPKLLLPAMIWGGIDGVSSLAILWALMFLAKPLQPLISQPLELFVVWLHEVFGIFLFGGHDIAAAFFWHSVYFVLVGFSVGFLLRFLISSLRSLRNRPDRPSHGNT